MDAFLQSLPSCEGTFESSKRSSKEDIRDIRIQAEHAAKEDIVLSDGCFYSYPEYEEDLEFSQGREKMWDRLKFTQQMSKSGIKILLMNIQLKDHSTAELSEISSMQKVMTFGTPDIYLDLDVIYN